MGEFLYVLCRENLDRLVKYVGMGNAMGYIHHRGLLSSSNSVLDSSSDNSSEDEYGEIEHLVDPMTGTIREAVQKEPMCEEDAQKIANDIESLRKLNVISPVTIQNGKLVPTSTLNREKLQE